MKPDERAIAAAQWWRELKESNNKSFLSLFFDEHRYLVLCGGGGSGKSIFAGRKVLERCTTEPGHRYLVCRKVGRTIKQSCFKQLCGQAQRYYREQVAQINKSDMVITFRNGSEIIFAGLDDVEKLKSIYDITGVWIEEASETLESDFNQLDIRLRGKTKFYKQIIITFNPVSILHWLKLRFFDKPDKRVCTHRSTYKDNRFLDAEAIEVLESFKHTDAYYYTVYCLGEWGVLGRSVFNAQAVTRRLLNAPKPLHIGYFDFADDGRRLTNIKWVDDEIDGFIRLYAEPAKGTPYVIGGDTAGDGSDSFVAQAIDNITGAQVATLRHKMDEDLYAKQVYALGMYYNRALIAIEANYSTYPIMELERLGYPKQYTRETVDDFTHKTVHSYGFMTSKMTRPVIISELIKVARDDITRISDKTTLEEMATFVRNEAFRPEAEAGAHDDCVMALAIAHHARGQQRMSVLTKREAQPEKLIQKLKKQGAKEIRR